MKKFIIKALFDRAIGYEIRGSYESAEEAAQIVTAIKYWHKPIDIYYCYNNNYNK